MFGLDVTHKVMTNPARVAAIRALDNPVAQAAAGMLDFFGKHDSENIPLKVLRSTTLALLHGC